MTYTTKNEELVLILLDLVPEQLRFLRLMNDLTRLQQKTRHLQIIYYFLSGLLFENYSRKCQ